MTGVRRTAALLLGAAVAALAVVAPASAAFLDTGTVTSGSVGTLTVQPPTGTTAVPGCTTLNLVGTPKVDASWTRSSQVSAGGAGWSQQLLLTSGATTLLAVTSSAVGAGSSSATITGTRTTAGGAVSPLAPLTTYTVLVRSTVGSWTSATTAGSSASVTTLVC